VSITSRRLRRFAARFLPLTACALLVGCIPYSVGSTARTVEPSERTRSTSAYLILNGVENLIGDSVARREAIPGVDSEIRFGVTPRADVGVRVPMLSGIVATYKQRLDRVEPDSLGLERGTHVALMPGAGFVNFGQHAHIELTLLVSDAGPGPWSAYGGVRGMQVFPIGPNAVRDSPTLGGFGGVRIGTARRAVLPEVAIYYDRSALGLRTGNVIFIPSLTTQGFGLRDFFNF
jgi:hypothetical protein